MLLLVRLADRSVVLVLGLVAGFLVGVSFVPHPLTYAGPSPSPAIKPTSPIVGRPLPAAPVQAAAQIPIAVAARMKRTGVFHVGVFGDSIGNGLWEALYRQLPQGAGYQVLRFSKEATGFTRYHALNLEDRARVQLAHEPIDAAVISFGANDAQAVFADGHLYPLLSDGWQRVIGDRIDRFVAVVRSTGAIVYWLGLPVMRDPQMDATMQQINAFYAQRMRHLGVPFVGTRALSVDRDGRYNAYLPDQKTGVPRLMRTGDGIHMIGIGYQRLTDGVARDLRAYAARVRRAAGRPATAAGEGGR